MEHLCNFINQTSEWDLYNGFFLHPDVERLRKFMAREHLFRMTINIPGDIVELGVFKGTGIAQMLKLREIFVPASNKKVVGFDLFSQTNSYQLEKNDETLQQYYQEANVTMNQGIKRSDVETLIGNMKLTNTRMGFNTDICQLIEGDVASTIPSYLENNPGFRISYLYFDLDIDEPTFISLQLLYDRVVRGGVIVFDEYACEKWSESNAIDRFLALHPELKIQTIPWARSPTAYIVKP